MATPKQFRRRGRWTLILGTLLATLTFGAVMAFASNSTTTNIPLNNNTAEQGTDCPTQPGAYWHFVTSPNNGGSAFVQFHLNLGDATTYDTTVFIPNGSQLDNVFVQVPAGKTLTSLIKDGSSADITGDASKFQLSHTCGGASETSTLTEVRDGDGLDVTSTALALGSVVHDHAKVEADDSSTPEGTVDFAFYKGTAEAPCSGDAVTNENDVDLTNGEADSKNTAALGAGSYGYIVTYNSSDESRWLDSKGDCEPFTINKAQLTVVTQIHNAAHEDIGGATSVPLGSIVHDTATVTGQVPGFDPTGAISFKFDGNDVANADPAEAGFSASTVDSAALNAGNHLYTASVEGDSNYEGAISGDEPLTVDKAQLYIVTYIHNAAHQDITGGNVTFGAIVHDTAVVTGGVLGFPIPAVSFTLNGNLVANDPSADGSATARSVDSDPLNSGAYVYKASVDGDANYLGATAADENLTVRVFGKTMGYWGNPNGITRISVLGYLDNAVAIGRGSNIDTQPEATKVLPNNSNLNACGKGNPIIFSVGPATPTAACKLATGININSLNTLAAQTLALGYNIKLVAGFTGQPLSALNCAPVLGLTGASTVNDAFAKAVSLIDGSSTGGATTQTQIGLMNTLLGCINAEA
jgi:hypothetical protein